jgi:acetyl-CoA C-acetyltransferase
LYNGFLSAENIAKQFNISRQEQDEFAYKSQKKAGFAMAKGYFSGELVAITVPGRKGPSVIGLDEFPKPETTLESLEALRPAFMRDGSGSVTAGNASGINDGAAALVLVSESQLSRMDPAGRPQPWARIVSQACTGLDPQIMGMGPVSAVRLAVSQ